ncbi:MAG: glutathione transferase GstA [Proteobacteria bacterium]|nr:glutathione transferase GstA [Pseudomonadota bacterium]
MKLYYIKGACSLAVRILINQLQLNCQYISVDLSSKKTQSGDDFNKINPKGYVPALLLDNDQLLTENIAIQQYLADTYPEGNLLPPIGDFNRYLVLEKLAFVSTELHKGFSPIFNPSIDAKIKNEIFVSQLQKKFSYLNQGLSQKKFLMGDHFTLPDAYFYVMLFWGKKFSLDFSNHQNLQAYFQRLSQHPAIKKSLEEEGLKV